MVNGIDGELRRTGSLGPEEDVPFKDEGGKAGPATDEELEAQYDAGAFRVVSQLQNYPIPALIQAIAEKQYLNIHPEYQRRLRWDSGRQSRLIESLLMNVPVPPVFLYETDLARYEVVDGQQRLATIDDFFAGRLRLRGLQYWTALDGRTYRNLPTRLQSALTRRSISAVVLLAESTIDAGITEKDVRRIVFERLNTGGVRLNAQEVRNAVDAGPFNDLLHELARSAEFTRAWGIPAHGRRDESDPTPSLARNLLYRTMGDCELVLRFFALQDLDAMASSLKRTLDDEMKNRATDDSTQLEHWGAEFLACLRVAIDIYGDEAFRLQPVRGRLSKPLYDAVMLGLRGHLVVESPLAASRLVAARDRIRQETRELLANPSSREYGLLVGRGNTKDSIRGRIELMQGLFGRVLQG
ncbi:MAG: DUF262 domain-containing protein [Dehalococcoidia bacterium]